MGADDESNLMNAQREVSEELGINYEDLVNKKHPLYFIETHKFNEGNFFCNIYVLIYNGEIKI